MKRIYITTIIFVLLTVSFVSCGLDNFDGPDASISGCIKDVEDGSLIEQDMDNGSKIIYVEKGWSNPEEQQMIFNVNGEYRNNLVFAGSYDIYFNESNFVKPDVLKEYKIKQGENKLDFVVQPYIRVNNVTIKKLETEIVATFTITPTVENTVSQIGLFGHIDRVVGNQYALDRVLQNIGVASKDTPTTYTLKLSTSKFKTGQEYYFRVGGLVNAANAKYNYAPAVRISI